MKLSGLIELVADELGEPNGVVRVKARALREAGLISQGGRGTAGAEMEARDVARLILAILSPHSTTADKVVATLERAPLYSVTWSSHRGYRSDARQGVDGQVPTDRLPTHLAHLGARMTITDALVALMADGAPILSLCIEGNQDGQSVTVGTRGEGDDPDSDGIVGWDWYLDFAVPVVSASRVDRTQSIDGQYLEEIAACALGRRDRDVGDADG
jgi:hypothetical protein